MAVSLFSRERGLFYAKEGSLKLIGVQLLGVVTIISWVAIISWLYFFFSMELDLLRMSDDEEILGGDLVYFGPMEFMGQIHNYDIE